MSMNSKKLFITGGTEPLGRFVCDSLIKQGHSIKALYRNEPGDNIDIEWIKGDLLDPSGYEEELIGMDAVIHLAEKVSYNTQDREMMYKVNVLGTKDLVNAALNYNIPSFIHLSTTHTLIRSAQAFSISLNAPGNPLFYTNYAKTKFQAELEVWRAAEEGLKICILNSALALVPSNDEQWFADWSEMFKNEIVYCPDGTIGLISAEDISNIIAKVLELEQASKQYLLCAEQWSFKELNDLLHQTIGKTAQKYKINNQVISVLATWRKLLESLSVSKSKWGSEWIKQKGMQFKYNTEVIELMNRERYKPIAPILQNLFLKIKTK